MLLVTNKNTIFPSYFVWRSIIFPSGLIMDSQFINTWVIPGAKKFIIAVHKGAVPPAVTYSSTVYLLIVHRQAFKKYTDKDYKKKARESYLKAKYKVTRRKSEVKDLSRYLGYCRAETYTMCRAYIKLLVLGVHVNVVKNARTSGSTIIYLSDSIANGCWH